MKNLIKFFKNHLFFPRNILITNDFKTLKFADFGYGKKLEPTEDNVQTNCGTLRYKVFSTYYFILKSKQKTYYNFFFLLKGT